MRAFQKLSGGLWWIHCVKAEIHYASFPAAGPYQLAQGKNMLCLLFRVISLFPNFITTTQQTCCKLFTNKSITSWQLPHLWGTYKERCLMNFGHYPLAHYPCCPKIYCQSLYHYRYLALMAGLASEADWVFIPEWPPQKGWEDILCKKLSAVSIEHVLHTM